MWTVEWRFPTVQLRLRQRLADSVSLRQVALPSQQALEQHFADPATFAALKPYWSGLALPSRTDGLADLKFYMAVPHRPANAPTHYLLPADVPLRTALEVSHL